MILAQSTKIVPLVRPAAIVNNASFTSQSIDCSGYSYAHVIFQLGALDIAITALKVQTSDDDSTYVDITLADFSVSPATLPAATDDNKIYSVYIPLDGKRKWLKAVATMGNGSTGGFLSALCLLSKAAQHPNTATERGNAQELFPS
jgi:hypothetical protein